MATVGAGEKQLTPAEFGSKTPLPTTMKDESSRSKKEVDIKGCWY
jgi:hypothetical protein